MLIGGHRQGNSGFRLTRGRVSDVIRLRSMFNFFLVCPKLERGSKKIENLENIDQFAFLRMRNPVVCCVLLMVMINCWQY